jgi:hypothetical protein
MVEQHEVQELLSNLTANCPFWLHVSEFSAGMESYNYCWTFIFVHAMQILNFQTWLQNGS